MKLMQRDEKLRGLALDALDMIVTFLLHCGKEFISRENHVSYLV